MENEIPRPMYPIGTSIVIKYSNHHKMIEIKHAYLPPNSQEWEYWANNGDIGWIKESDIICSVN